MRVLHRLLCASLMACGAAFAAAPAAAQTRDPIAAEAVFRDGRAAVDRGDHERARLLFAESHRLDPSSGALLNLAYAEEKTGRVASAWQHYHELIDRLPPDDRRLAFARARVVALEPRLPRLTVRPAAPLGDDVTVLRDGVALRAGSLGVALPIDPGAHLVVVRAQGRPDRTYDITVREGEPRELIVEPAPPPPASSPPAPPRAAPPADRPAGAAPSAEVRPLGWVLGGAGLIGLALGSVAGVMALAQDRTVDAHCDAEVHCDREGYEAAQAGRVWATVSTVSFAVGIPATGLGAYLVLRGAAAPPARAAPSARATAAALVVTGSF